MTRLRASVSDPGCSVRCLVAARRAAGRCSSSVKRPFGQPCSARSGGRPADSARAVTDVLAGIRAAWSAAPDYPATAPRFGRLPNLVAPAHRTPLELAPRVVSLPAARLSRCVLTEALCGGVERRDSASARSAEGRRGSPRMQTKRLPKPPCALCSRRAESADRPPDRALQGCPKGRLTLEERHPATQRARDTAPQTANNIASPSHLAIHRT